MTLLSWRTGARWDRVAPVPPPRLDELFLREELPLRQRELDQLGLPLE